MTIHHERPLSGYGSTSNVVAKALDKSGIKEPLEKWDEETVKKIVEYFMDERFPTIVVCVFVYLWIWKSLIDIIFVGHEQN